MRVDLVKPIYSSFLSCEKDMEAILKKLFVDNPKHAEQLKRLLVIQTKDCLDNTESEVYKKILENFSVSELVSKGYVRTIPKISMGEHEEVKAYLIFSFDNFTPNATNPQFRDCLVHIDIICHTDCWDLGDYRNRPIKIAGYIDGLLNNARLSGIGTLQFLGLKQMLLTEDISGYSLTYGAIHGSDDVIPSYL